MPLPALLCHAPPPDPSAMLLSAPLPPFSFSRPPSLLSRPSACTQPLPFSFFLLPVFAGPARSREAENITDQFGREGLKGQMPPEACAGARSPGYAAPEGGAGAAGSPRFNPRNAEDIFAEFFGGASPFGPGVRMGGMGPSGRMGGMGPNGMGGMGGMGMGDSAQFQSMFGTGAGGFSRSAGAASAAAGAYEAAGGGEQAAAARWRSSTRGTRAR